MAQGIILTPLTCEEAEERQESQPLFSGLCLVSQPTAAQPVLSELTFPSGYFSLRQLSIVTNFYLAAFPYCIQLEGIFNSSSNPPRMCTYVEKASLTSELCPKLKG